MRNICICFLVFFFTSNGIIAQKKSDFLPYKDVKLSIEERVEDLLSRMTLEEKVLQLNQYTLGRNTNVNNIGKEVDRIPAEIGSLIYFNDDAILRNQMQKKAIEESRLGIPILFGYDVIHGFRTIYPIPLAQSSSWNKDLVKQACAIAAQEARASGIDWTFSPMVDVARDGRWGRVAEGYGEDTYTNAVFAVASVEGYQGKDLSNNKNIAACLKHYVGYGASEGGRDYVYTEISKQSLWDTYLPPFQAGVNAEAATIMSGFNYISGIPASANHYTLTEIVKNRWKHAGFIVSDWSSIKQLRTQGLTGNLKEAAKKAFLAGLEMDMMNNCYDKYLAELVEEGEVSIDRINDATKRVLHLKFKLGLFENPYTIETLEENRFLLSESLKVAEKLAEESIVLLKNENNILPLVKPKKIALIGPLVEETRHLLGSWDAHGKSEDVISIRQGLEDEFKNKIQLSYAKGCNFDGNDKSKFPEASGIAADADIIIICLGEKKTWSGENASRSTIALPQIQEELVFELKKIGKPIILLLSSGRPLELNRIEPLSNAILEVWQPGTVGGKAIAGILSGRVNPSGKLSITFPYSTGQIPIYYNYRQAGRPTSGKYQDIPTAPLYEFAHGLSYTTFTYGEIKASTTTIKRGNKLTFEVPVTNTGNMDGAETVHWFISDPVCSITRPIKELKYFEKQMIKVGETKIFHFEVDLERDLGFIDSDGKKFLESGEFLIMVKNKSERIELVD